MNSRAVPQGFGTTLTRFQDFYTTPRCHRFTKNKKGNRKVLFLHMYFCTHIELYPAVTAREQIPVRASDHSWLVFMAHIHQSVVLNLGRQIIRRPTNPIISVHAVGTRPRGSSDLLFP